ncbi:hypothetical protein cand_009930 [Cryptosporidium andersoni]|uniref:Uncharacterized protein n=1 Tax=Cryptosporidium andersoni TaxID=117008 RepID=A0A1J4MT33_9CRYT|nr:hypothetical protein cand_009930 [Cryptosporidium andersoni]
MESIFERFQLGIIDRDKALELLENYVNKDDREKFCINIISHIIKEYDLRELQIQNVMNLLVIFACLSKNKKLDLINRLTEELLLAGTNVKDVKVRINSIITFKIFLKIIKDLDLKFEISKDWLSRVLILAASDKSSLVRICAIECLSLLNECKEGLLDILCNSKYHNERIKAMTSLSIESLSESELTVYLSRLLDKSPDVRKSLFKVLKKNCILLYNMVNKEMKWSHILIVIQFGLNDRDEQIIKVAIRFLLNYILNNYGNNGQLRLGCALKNFIEDMFFATTNTNDITTPNVEATAELIFQHLIKNSNYNIREFLNEIFHNKIVNFRDSSNIFSKISPGQLLLLRITIQNYIDIIYDEYFLWLSSYNEIIQGISSYSNNSFVIRQILLIANNIDLSDPEIRGTLKDIAKECIQHCPIEDSWNSLETELTPLESLVRIPEGGEWVAYFLHRSALWSSLQLFHKCQDSFESIDDKKFINEIQCIINNIIEPESNDIIVSTSHDFESQFVLNFLSSKTLLEHLKLERGTNKSCNAVKYDDNSIYNSIRDILELRWMRVLFIIEGSLSMVDSMSICVIDYWSNNILKPCISFFLEFNDNSSIPQILFVRCIALISIFEERLNLDTSLVVENRLSYFIQGLKNALEDLENCINKQKGLEEVILSDSLLLAVQCELYVSAITDIIVIRQTNKYNDLSYDIQNDLNTMEALKTIWSIISAEKLATYRLTSISLRGFCKLLLCFQLNNSYQFMMVKNALNSLIYFVYCNNVCNEFEVLIKPQHVINKIFYKEYKSVRNNCEVCRIDNVHKKGICFLIQDIIELIKGNNYEGIKDNCSMYTSSGDKQMILYFISLFITISTNHLKCLTIALFDTFNYAISNISKNTCFKSYNEENINKLIVFGIIQISQAFRFHLSNNKEMKIDTQEFNPQFYGIICLMLSAVQYPKYCKKISIDKQILELLQYMLSITLPEYSGKELNNDSFSVSSELSIYMQVIYSLLKNEIVKIINDKIKQKLLDEIQSIKEKYTLIDIEYEINSDIIKDNLTKAKLEELINFVKYSSTYKRNTGEIVNKRINNENISSNL